MVQVLEAQVQVEKQALELEAQVLVEKQALELEAQVLVEKQALELEVQATTRMRMEKEHHHIDVGETDLNMQGEQETRLYQCSSAL